MYIIKFEFLKMIIDNILDNYDNMINYYNNLSSEYEKYAKLDNKIEATNSSLFF